MSASAARIYVSAFEVDRGLLDDKAKYIAPSQEDAGLFVNPLEQWRQAKPGLVLPRQGLELARRLQDAGVEIVWYLDYWEYQRSRTRLRAAMPAAEVAEGRLEALLHRRPGLALTAVKNQRGKAAAKALGDHATEANTERYLRDREIPVVDGPTMIQTA